MKAGAAKCCPSCGERYGAEDLFCPRDGTPLASTRSPSFSGAERDPYLGVELAGQIRIKHLIGIGSMGRVYRAFQAGIDRDVAVKILHRELSGNAELVGRFHREAKVASRLVHPNVVQVLMTGAVPPQDGGRIGGELFLVMEHLDGISLLSALAAAGATGDGDALPLPRALHIALQVCDAVGEAHAQGIVHRDLKPENVMLVRRGDDTDFVKVLDFGIARLTWGDKSMATQAGLIFGTAKYISPEGAEGLPVGPQADVYSIATILYQCLAGRTPFDGDSHVGVLVQHAHSPPPPLTSVPRASYVPAPLEAAIMKNLSKRASDRAADAKALGRELISASRASGLAPEDIIPRSSLLPGARPGAVKLASKERTKSLELAPDLALRIGGVAAKPEEAPPTPARESDAKEDGKLGDATPVLGTPTPLAASTHRASTAGGAGGATVATAPTLVSAAVGEGSPLGKSSPSLKAPAQGEEPKRALELAKADARGARREHSDEPSALAEAPRASSAPSTIQGTETTLDPAPLPAPRPPRPWLATAIAIAACAAAAVVFVAAGAGKLGGSPAQQERDTLDAYLEEARDCMRKRAWDGPSEPNVKDITARALARWPDDPRVKEIRREAAERAVAESLGRKYAGDIDGAIAMARLALELSPALTTAQHLLADLTQEKQSRAPGAPKVPASADAAGRDATAKGAPRGGGGRDARGGPELRPKTKEPAPALPPPPPPLPTNGTAPPASTGPWL